MPTSTMPNTVELVHRLHRAARLVVVAVDTMDEYSGRGVVSALAVWETITGIDDDTEAVAYARRVADPEWITRAMAKA